MNLSKASPVPLDTGKKEYFINTRGMTSRGLIALALALLFMLMIYLNQTGPQPSVLAALALTLLVALAGYVALASLKGAGIKQPIIILDAERFVFRPFSGQAFNYAWKEIDSHAEAMVEKRSNRSGLTLKEPVLQISTRNGQRHTIILRSIKDRRQFVEDALKFFHQSRSS